MEIAARIPFRRLLGTLASGLMIAAAPALAAPAPAGAAVMTFGSPLSVPASLNTAHDLGYLGTYTNVPPSPEVPNGVFHTPHWGADTALWNSTLATGQAAAPATGQAVKVSLEGCAQADPSGPAPLTQIHFQDLSPQPGAGARVNISSQGFDLPVCGRGGASGATVTTYEPLNLCVSAGDYVAFNDEGGYVPNVYRAGVPYEVIGNVQGSTMDSFIRNNGVGNGALLGASDRSANDGFVANSGEELMLRVTLGTGADATHICPGGTAGAPAVLAPLRVSPQTDGVNHSQNVAVAIYCRGPAPCGGTATLGLDGRAASATHTRFTLSGGRTSHLTLHLSALVMRMIRRHHGVSALLSIALGSAIFHQHITVKIL